jgi:hypothetical protein
MVGWGDDEEFAPGTAGGFNAGQDLIGPSGQVILPPDPIDPPDRTWGQQFGDWLGIGDATQGKIASASKALKTGLGDFQQINKLADPNAQGQQRVGQVGPAPTQQRAAPTLDDVLQQLLQRRAQLGQLGLSGRAYAPRGPGGGLLGM